MKILVYFNVVNKNFNVIICNDYSKEVGDTYKTNSLLISIIDPNKTKKPIKIILKHYSFIKYKIGQFLINLGNILQGKKKVKISYHDNKTYPWWK